MKNQAILNIIVFVTLATLLITTILGGAAQVRQLKEEAAYYKAQAESFEQEVNETRQSCTEEHRVLVQGFRACEKLRSLEATPLFTNNPEITEMIDDFYSWESEVKATRAALKPVEKPL